jgi:hypothetical protein
MIMISRMATVQRRCWAGPAATSCAGNGSARIIVSGLAGESYGKVLTTDPHPGSGKTGWMSLTILENWRYGLTG